MIHNSCTSFVDQWLGKSPGRLSQSPYSGPATFKAKNKVPVPGHPGLALVILFYKPDGKQFAIVGLLLCMSLVL